MASPTRWTWVWASSRCWWWTGKPGMLESMGSQRVRHTWATELNLDNDVFHSISETVSKNNEKFACCCSGLLNFWTILLERNFSSFFNDLFTGRLTFRYSRAIKYKVKFNFYFYAKWNIQFSSYFCKYNKSNMTYGFTSYIKSLVNFSPLHIPNNIVQFRVKCKLEK